jgi:hypothetical protein
MITIKEKRLLNYKLTEKNRTRYNRHIAIEAAEGKCQRHG